MEIGFINDRDPYNGGPNQWLEGSPERTWLGSLKFKGKRYLEIVTYRCPRCGMLEMVAPDPNDVKALAAKGAISPHVDANKRAKASEGDLSINRNEDHDPTSTKEEP